MNNQYQGRDNIQPNQRLNLGLKTLGNICGIENNLNTYHLGYVIGPRINAAGRIKHAKHALELLICNNDIDKL